MNLTGTAGTLTIGDPDDPKSLKVSITSWSATIDTAMATIIPYRPPSKEPAVEIVPIKFTPLDAEKIASRLEDWILRSFQLPAPLVRGGEPALGQSRLLVVRCAMMLDDAAEQFGRQLLAAHAESLHRETLDAVIRELECRRWLSRGGPLASWYRRRPGWRFADLMDTRRN